MAKYIKIVLENSEPLQFADDSRSVSEQSDTLSYIPGSALRGAVVWEMIRRGCFEENKTALLLEQVRFFNGYPCFVSEDKKEHPMLPAIKGFYEDKTEETNSGKQIENMLLTGEISPGNKRASLGGYCYPDAGTLLYGSVKLGSDMKIAKREKKIFRNQYIEPGYKFITFIAVEDENKKLAEELLNVLKEAETITLGGGRSYGFGKCRILHAELIQELPYAEYAQREDVKDKVYLMLLSAMGMRDKNGQPAGIDLDSLGEKLGLGTDLNMELCSTSIVEVRGYNRTWGAFLPSAKMYEAGSVFKLEFEGKTVSGKNLCRIMEEGLGIRRNEGFGCVLFLKDPEDFCRKKKVELKPEKGLEKESAKGGREALTEEEKQTLKIAAKGYYLQLIQRAMDAYLVNPSNNIRKFGLNGTQLGTIQSILYTDLYHAEQGFERLELYFQAQKGREEKKKVQNGGGSRIPAFEHISRIRRKDPEEILGIPEKVMGYGFKELFSENEQSRIKIRLLTEQIRYRNREGKYE